jgi:hypothetical protein
MRKIVYKMFIIMVLFIWSMLLVSCEAITAQNITNTGSTPGMNGGQKMNGSPGRNGGPGMNGGPGKDGDSVMNGNASDN